MRALYVFKEERSVGVITLDEDGKFEFQYSQDWIKAQEAPISFSLPVVKEKYSSKLGHSFFSNLLPEGDVRKNLCEKLGISIDNDYELLKAIGGECAGALVILESQNPETQTEEYKFLSTEELASEIKKGATFTHYSGESGARLSLAGAQDKMPVLLRDGFVYLPLGNSVSTHIFKFPSRYDKNLTHNECFLLHLAKFHNLNSVSASIYPIGEFDVLSVKRYDRVRLKTGKLHRLHQEDFCQISNIHQNKKYEKEGGPNFSKCMNIVREFSDDPLTDSLRLIRWMIFNVLTGNADGHAKNLSIFHNSAGESHLAPFYDLVCTRAYERLDKNLAMTVGTQNQSGNITGTHWKKWAQDIGVTAKLVISEVEKLSHSLIKSKDQALNDYFKKNPNNEILERISMHITKQCRRTLDQLKN